jgi:hypothetical protein
MASLAAFATRNFTAFFAGILIAAPVAGLRPMRALRSTRTSRPSPGITNTPFFLTSLIALPASVVIKELATFFVTSHFSARVWTICDCVMVFLPFRFYADDTMIQPKHSKGKMLHRVPAVRMSLLSGRRARRKRFRRSGRPASPIQCCCDAQYRYTSKSAVPAPHQLKVTLIGVEPMDWRRRRIMED